jgi:hypothetical protein
MLDNVSVPVVEWLRTQKMANNSNCVGRCGLIMYEKGDRHRSGRYGEVHAWSRYHSAIEAPKRASIACRFIPRLPPLAVYGWGSGDW